MALLCGSRYASQKLISSLRYLPYASASSAPAPKLEIKAYVPPQTENYDHKNMRLKRPMSPHLSIYAPQLTSTMSISHRFTGMILSGYFMALGCGALVLPADVSFYINTIDGFELPSAVLFAMKYLLALPLSYHYINGIRHLIWDTARGLTIKNVYSSGYAILAATALSTGVLACL